MKEVILSLKKTRADLIALEALLLTIKDSRETASAYTHLQEARMQCGNLIKEFNPEGYPYPDSMNPKNEKIEPLHVDENVYPMQISEETKSMSKIQLVKFLRVEVDERIKYFRVLAEDMLLHYPMVQSMMIMYSLTSSKNWLGMELGRLRDLYHDFGSL